jgi:two-component system response regulator QseB
MTLSALIIEDDYDLGDMIAEVFRDYVGWDIEWIRNGQEAFEYLNHCAPDLIVLDLHLPDVSGMDILSYIRGGSDAKKAKTPVIIITADAILARDAEAMADIVLVKPMHIDEMILMAQRLAGEMA